MNTDHLDEDEIELLQMQKEFFETGDLKRNLANICLKTKENLKEKIVKQKVTFAEKSEEEQELENFKREKNKCVSFVKVFFNEIFFKFVFL